MSSLLFESYSGNAVSPDEWKDERPGVSAAYEHVENVLSAYAPAELERLTRRAQELMQEQGITFTLYDDSKSTERILPFDLFPLTVSAEEWTGLEIGLAQRVKAWNCLLRDIYGTQEILKAGVIPYDIVYGDPRYCRECVGLKPVGDIYLHVAAVDLFRDTKGKWLAVEDQLSNPTGASYALQNRRTLSQLCPQLIEGQNLTPVHHYPTQLLETLQAVTPTGRSTARVVLLSPGIYNEGYYDHSSLARQMGIPLVQGGDLIVLDNHVYLKTIAGLERVEVIYRRLDSAYMDPITFRPDSLLGVPGLVSCVRKGTVTIANALGSDIADNRALNAHMPEIIEFYLNERAVLPSVQTLSCRDIDIREDLYDHWDRYVIKSAANRSASEVWAGNDLDEGGRADLRNKIEKRPVDYVIQPVVHFSTSPTWVGSSLEPRHVGIRAFVLHREEPLVTPCVLTRYANSAGSLVISSASGGGTKDTWLLRGPRRENAVPEATTRYEGGRLSLGSRTAESLYWIGRYTERAEATTRILRVIQQLRLEGAAFQDARSWQPLWDALASATGHSTRFFKKPTIQQPLNLAQYILLDDENYASTISCLRRTRRNCQAIREVLPPEVWTVMNSLYLDLSVSAELKTSTSVLQRLQSFALQDEILTRLDELSGSVEKHMLHNDAWHFWQIGRHLERSLFTVLTMRQVFLKRSDERLGGTSSATPFAEDDNLDALLRMLAGQYAYRSSYHTRPVAAQVARLLIQDDEFPRSIVFGLEAIRHSLEASFGEKKLHADTPLHYCRHLLSELLFADVASYFPAVGTGDETPALRARQRSRAFADWLQEIINRLFNLGTQISDHYLNHQAASPVRSA